MQLLQKGVVMIPVKKYFDDAIVLSKKEAQLRDEFMDWLPDEIIDAHVHNGCEEHVLGLDEGIYNHMMSTFPWFTLELSSKLAEILFPGKRVRRLRFSKAARGFDHRAINSYLFDHASDEDRIALYGIPDDSKYTIGLLDHPRVVALKMYHQFFNPPATDIHAYFPRDILHEAQEKGIPIILHLPVLITKCADQLHKLMQDFPRLTVVLAHLGLPHVPVPGLGQVYKDVAQYPNLHMDTAMIPSKEVVAMAIDAFGYNRILFGTDEPLNLIRAIAYHHPEKGERLATQYPYHWVDVDDHRRFGHLAQDAILMHWDQLSAIRSAIEQVVDSDERDHAKQAIFQGNAKRIYSF